MKQQQHSRRTDPSPLVCPSCGWQGQRKDCHHDYKGYGNGEETDVEPVDRCPKCGEIEPDPVLAVVTV